MKRLGLLLVVAMLIVSGCSKMEVLDYTQLVTYCFNMSADTRLYNSLCSSAVNYEALKEAVEDGSDVNKLCRGTSQGDVPLVLASVLGDKRAAEYLIKQGADVNVTSEDGTPVVIYWAEDAAMLKLFADNGYSFDTPDDKDKYPLDYAIDTHNMRIITNILKYCTHISDNGMKELIKATEAEFCAGGTVILSELAAKDSITSSSAVGVGLSKSLRGKSVKPEEVNPKYKSLTLYATAANGSSADMSLLFKSLGLSVDINKLLSCAVAAGNISTAAYLISSGADINMLEEYTDGTTVWYFSLLDTAAYYNRTDMVKYLVGDGFGNGFEYREIEGNTYTPLDYAVLNNNAQLVSLLLAEYPDMGCSVATYCDSDKVFSLLLKYNKLDGWKDVVGQSKLDRLKAYYKAVGAPNSEELLGCINALAKEDKSDAIGYLLEQYEGDDREQICGKCLLTAIKYGSYASIEVLTGYLTTLECYDENELENLWVNCTKSRRIYSLIKEKYAIGG